MENLNQKIKTVKKTRIHLIGILVLSLLIFSCSGDNDSPPPIVNVATSVTLVSGENQSALKETTLTNPIEVIVTDQEGTPFAGAAVIFSVSEGSVSSQTQITNSEGKASVNWTLGETTGDQSLTMTVFKADGVTPIINSPMNVNAIALRPIIVGEFHEGGVVFFVDDSSIHGLVCTTQSIGNFIWGCPGTEINGADDLEIGGGQQNTLDILNGCNQTRIAAKACDVLVLNGFDDWFLPSKLELNEMAINRDIISATSIGNGGNLLSGKYWCSSEFDSNTALRRTIDGVAISFAVVGKDETAHVRAVRAF